MSNILIYNVLFSTSGHLILAPNPAMAIRCRADGHSSTQALFQGERYLCGTPLGLTLLEFHLGQESAQGRPMFIRLHTVEKNR